MAGAGNGSLLGPGSGDQPLISDINVTPLVDVMLVILVIFLVTARFIIHPVIEVERPKAAAGQELKTTLAITLDAARTYYVNGKPVAGPEAVTESVQLAVRTNPGVQVLINADQSVFHGEVIALIDRVKLAGASKFAVAVERPE